MKIVQKGIIFFSLACVIGCSSYKAKKQEAQLNLPQLGALVKTEGGMLYHAAQQVGVPNWNTLKIDIQELPFNMDSYVRYASHMQRAGKRNTIPYNDSLRYKPKYIRLQLLDKVGLTTLLNGDDHQQMRSYLSLDDNHRLVTSLDLALTEAEVQEFLNASGVQLTKDNLANLVLELFFKDENRTYLLKDLPAFNYGLSTFCWGEDKYHHIRIQNIVLEDFKCPNNTYLKASKIKSDKPYLKF